ncbi:putative mediator of RNA polymerase II transcription subunit 26a [Bienertia sinuspersici]
MHGWEIGSGSRKRIRHMRPVSISTGGVAAAVDDSSVVVVAAGSSSPSSFYKDGRKISVGDCALFKPAEDSPPFVGIIRCLISEKESNLKLRVNWLYRPDKVKLPKGVALEAALNEVFYSFHSDEIPAASLLHPCKVAFLRKGVELPPGISSFVCRRVYDITNKCLWWLTDQDYIDERQEEVDQLLRKTRIEMHESIEQQQGPRSPKPVNGSAATSPLKHSPDSVQTSSSNLSTHKKGKKRERGEQSFEAIKRERSSRPDDGESGQLKSESLLNLEISKFSEKGGLVDSEAVMRLVQLMQPEKSSKKIDLTGRSMLAGIIAATEKHDCLNQFVQLRGLFVLNEWLQEVHKGKIGDSGNLRNGDKSVDDFLLVLLRALDKLPVNLNALQMCNIGKSVNHLRSHKNPEIQKKARSLVDTWKKRVEAEMNINDTKSGSNQAVPWPGRSQHDNSHCGSRHSSGSDAAVRSSITHHSSLKSASVKPLAVESNSKYTPAHPPGGARSTLSPTSITDNYKDGQSRITANGGSSDPQTAPREEKSSSSSQSHTNSQCSGDQPKNMVPCGKEETRRSTAGSKSLNKTVGCGTKHHKSANGPYSGVQRETASNRSSSLAKTPAAEKESNNAVDASVQESSNHKLIVKIPNRGPGVTQSINGGSLEDSSCRNSRASSPAFLEKHDQSDSSLRVNRHDSQQFPEVDGPSTSVPLKTSETKRFATASKIPCSPSRNDTKSSKGHDSSFSSMNALIESCAKFSETNVPISAGDDVGMNLLASVAAREISKSGTVSPAVSPHRHSKLAENSTGSHSGNRKQLPGDDAGQESCQSTDVADTDNHISAAGVSKVDAECSKQCDVKTETENLSQTGEDLLKSNGTSDIKAGVASPPVSLPCTTGRSVGDHGADFIKKNTDADGEIKNEPPVASKGLDGCLEADDKAKVVPLNDDIEKRVHQDTASCPSKDDNDKSNASQELQSNIALDQKSAAVALQSDHKLSDEKLVVASCGTSQHLAAVNSNDVKIETTRGADVFDTSGSVSGILGKESDSSFVPEKQVEPGVCCADVYEDRLCNNQNSENKGALVQPPSSSAAPVSCSAVPLAEAKLLSAAVEAKSEVVSGSATENVALSAALGAPDADAKLGFDLNEGLSADEGKNGEPVDLGTGSCPDIVCSVSPLQIPVSSACCSLPASVTVAAAAKGPFVPPDDLLWNKRELGWKGSAATSAFRPAEPRKVIEMPLGANKALVPDAPVSKPARFPLDIDLNVADESSDQDSNVGSAPACEFTTTSSLRSSGGLDLDLNKVDEAPDMAYMGQQIGSNIQKVERSAQHIKPLELNVFSNGEASGRRDFDLNNGPATEESPVEQLPSCPYSRGNIALQPSLGPRAISSDARNCFSWYPPGTSYSVSVTPSALSDREAFSIVGIGGGPQRVMGGPTSSLSFNPDTYRGSVLSSSPALPFHTPPFQYPVLPFGTNYPLSTPALAGGSSAYTDPAAGGRISAIPSQFAGNPAAVSFQYPHAYVVSRSIPDGGNNGVIESNPKWGKQGLDLNCGPGVFDVDAREESLPTVTRQVPTINPQSVAEEQARMYCMGGGHPKRKEPEGDQYARLYWFHSYLKFAVPN